jgi:hypothetical protein
MVLIFGGQFAEITAPTPHPNDQIGILLRMLTRCQKCGRIETVDLQLLPAHARKTTNQQSNLLDPLGIAKDGVGQFHRHRAAIVDALVIDFRK